MIVSKKLLKYIAASIAIGATAFSCDDTVKADKETPLNCKIHCKMEHKHRYNFKPNPVRKGCPGCGLG